MTLAVSNPMTLAEFLAWEERQAEFDGVRPVAMTGGTRAHATVQANLAIVIGGRLRGGPCRFYGSDLKIKTGDDHIRYPDGFVACTPGESASTVVSDPVVVFELLSPSTSAVDRIVKAREYQPRLRCSATSCWSRTASARRSTRASARAGLTKSWSRIRPSPFPSSASRFRLPNSMKASSSRRKRRFARPAVSSVNVFIQPIPLKRRRGAWV
jgi:hypothetical protein